MQDLAFEVITQTAEQLGLPPGRVFFEGKDNLTVPRPRIELQFMGETYRHLVRNLGISRIRTEDGYIQELKREIYTVREQVGVNVLADNEAWLKEFSKQFVKEFPRGRNDASGNWVKLRAASAEGKQPLAKRVGTTEIKVFTKVSNLIVVTLEGRITEIEQTRLLETVNIKLPSFR